MRYFNVELEFDRNEVDRIIDRTIREGEKGYVCSVESNNLTVANTNPEFLKVMNAALVNICDGSNLAKLIGRIHGKPFKSYVGADLFDIYIRKKTYRQFFLGNTEEVLSGLKKHLSLIDPKIEGMRFETLPFRKVEEFDYEGIAEMINEDAPDIIWVSLGAPKQEFFMSNLLPYLHRGVMFGFGAIFNFNAGKEASEVHRAPKWMLRLHLEWLYRAMNEPKKNIPRYWRAIRLMPRLVREERQKVRNRI